MVKKKRSSYFTRMLKVCRQEWSRGNAERKECFLRARITSSTPKIVKWCCNTCGGEFALSEVDCDHIIPICNTIPENMTEFLECFRLLHAPLDKLQILCKSCHKIKTKEELSLSAMYDHFHYAHTTLKEKGFPTKFLDDLTRENLKKLSTILKKNSEKSLLKFIKTFG